MLRPDKVRESIDLFIQAYEAFPDIVALNQIALAYEMLGEFESARAWYRKMREHAESAADASYLDAAVRGLERVK